MNVLFLTMSSGIENMDAPGIYTDLMRKFRNEGHEVYIIFPRERRCGLPTEVTVKDHIHSLGVCTLNVTKTNVIEKGIGQMLLESQFKKALNKYFSDVQFDLILYSTPPITFTSVIKYASKCNPEAMKYLLLKDIFPQNAVDLGILSKSGIKGLLYKTFRRKEKELYRISDHIGCMSPANVDYVIKHNPEVDPKKVEVAPNSYDLPYAKHTVTDKDAIRTKYGLPVAKPIFIYVGNMGNPQGIPFLLECMKAVQDRNDCHFVIVGNGTEYPKLESWVQDVMPKSVSLFQRIPKEDYDLLANACDVGLIFLDWRFTIPNYPSRLLPYLMEKKPIIAVTDRNCDTGKIAEENGYGFWCPSNSVEAFINVVNKSLISDLSEMGEKGYQYYLENYTIKHTYETIIKHVIR